MASTVQYNPQTGKKLKAGEKVVVNGKTFTQGSTSLGGTSTPISTGGSSGSSSGSASIAATQTQINQLGRNVPGFKPLVVDGILGTRTHSEMARFGIGSIGAATAKFAANKIVQNSTPIRTTQGTSYSNTFASSVKVGASPFSMFGDWVKKTADSLGTTFGNIGKRVNGNNTLGVSSANADSVVTGAGAEKPAEMPYQGYVVNPRDPSAGVVQPDPLTPFQIATDFGGQVVDKVGNVVSDVGNSLRNGLSSTMVTYDANTDNPTPDAGNLSTMNLNLDTSTPLPTDTTGTNTAGTDTTITNEVTDPNTGVNTKVVQNSPLGSNSMVGSGSSGGSPLVVNNNGITNSLTGLDSKLGSINNNPFLSDKSKTQNVLTVTDSTIQDLANQTPDASIWKTPFYQQKLNLINQKNGTNITAEDIAGKVQTTTTGLTPPKTTAEFLAYQNKATEDQRKLLNESIANDYNFTQAQKDIYLGTKDAQGNDVLLGVAAQQKKDNEAMSAFLDKQLANQETSMKEKAQYALDKAQADFNSQDATTEINRVTAKNNLTEFLAKIGALRTDGAALTGLETLEQAYQAQRQSLKQSFDFSKREINMNLNDNIYNLESAKDEKILKLNQDLSLTEREITTKVMELDYNFNKDMLSIKTKWSDAIQSEKDKAEAKAQKASEDWTSQFFTISGAATFKNASSQFQTEWMNNNYFPDTSNKSGYLTGSAQVGKQVTDYNTQQTANQPTENYTATNIPNDVQTSLQENLAAGTSLNDLIALYPEVSTSYLTSLSNNYSK